MYKRSFWLIICLFLVSGFYVVSSMAANENEQQLKISSLKSDPLIVGKEAKVKVHVAMTENKKSQDQDQAMVMLTLSKGQHQENYSFNSIGNGDYETTIKLNSTGKWHVSLVALNKERQQSEGDMDTKETTWEVKEHSSNPLIWWISGIVIAVIIIGFGYWFYKNRKRQRG